MKWHNIMFTNDEEQHMYTHGVREGVESERSVSE